MSEEHPGATSSTLEDILAQRRRSMLQKVFLVVVLLAALAGAAWWLVPQATEPLPQPELRPTLPPPHRMPPPPPPAPKPPEPPPPVEPPPLPEVDASDPLVRESARELSDAAQLEAWLAPEELIRRLVAAVDNLAHGRSPREQLDSLWPSDEFVVRIEDERAVVDPASWSRYDTATEVFVSLDPRKSLALYRRLQPLFEQAYRDLGYPEGSFDDAIADAIDELLRAPVLVGDVALSEQIISWEYADPELESLSSAQKQLLRTGPTNAPRIQRQLRAMAIELGVRPSDLPISLIHESSAE